MRAGTELKVLVYEWVTGGGLAGLPMPTEWAAEARRDAPRGRRRLCELA